MTLKDTDTFSFHVKNRQTIDNETNFIEENGIGSCRVKNNKIYLIYKSEYEGDVQTTTVIADADCIHIKRNGSVKSDIKYILNKQTFFRYYLPYGFMDMEVKTERIVNELSENGGKLRIAYILKAQDGSYSNDIEIVVEKL